MAAKSITLPDSFKSGGRNAGSAATGADQSALGKVTSANKKAEVGAWRIPTLSKNFKLDIALNQAANNAYLHMNKLLANDGMYLDVQAATQIQHPSAQKNSTEGQNTALIKEKGTQKPLKVYTEQDVLKLYAHNQGRGSIIVDGKV